MKYLTILFCFASAGFLRAEKISIAVEAGRPAEIVLPWRCDDSCYKNPGGYVAPSEASERVVQKVTIEAIGNDPLNLWRLAVNKKETLSNAGLEDWFRGESGSSLWSMYNRWREYRFHGTTGLHENYNAWGIINLWGMSLCGHDARSFGYLAGKAGIASRLIPMNRHEVNEYKVRGEWVVLDTDQNLYYLKLDGVSAASFEDLKRDPFLVLRTKPFGRYSAWTPYAAWSNLALFDFAPAKTLQFMWPKSPGLNALKREPYTLFGGESVVFHYDSALQKAGDKRLSVDDPQCGMIDFHYDTTKRLQQGIGLSIPYPRDTGGANQKPSFETPEKTSVIATYGSRRAFPQFLAGTNTVTLNTLDGKGKARISVEFSKAASDRILPPAPILKLDSVERGNPHIDVMAPEASRIWWQLSADKSFEMVSPNFDKVDDASAKGILIDNYLDQTFLLPGTKYHVRAKACKNGLWSDWSPPISLTVDKPEAPNGISCTSTLNGQEVIVRWNASPGNMLIYGSNRADFLPDIYCDTEASLGVITAKGELSIDWKHSQNQLCIVSAGSGVTVVPKKNFYRLIRKDGNTFSVPSSILALNRSDSSGLPRPTIFARSKNPGSVGEIVAQPIELK
jgi:hypothetical protein